MKLQNKVMLIMVCTWLLICVTVVIYSKLVVAHEYQNLEQVVAKHKIKDMQKGFDSALNSLSLYNLAWSQWDDASYFMETKNSQFIQSNFVDAIYRSAKLNFILFLDNDGHLHYGKVYNAKTNQLESVPQALLDDLNHNKSFLKHSNDLSSKAGILQTKLGLIVMSSRPVVASNAKGPIHGTLLMGYYLDAAVFQTLSDTIDMKTVFYPMSVIATNPELTDIFTQLTTGRESVVKIATPTIDDGYVLLKDINDAPTGIARITIPRLIYQEGILTTHHYFTIVLLSGIIVILLMWYLMKIFVLDRVISIDQQMSKLNSDKKYDQKIHVSGQDELSHMVLTINNMLAIIYHSQRELKYLASHDTLTQLPNRVLFYQLLNQALTKANLTNSKVAVMFLDIDKLKQINDNYGHTIGDQLIRLAAERLNSLLRKTDVLARQSGDEFILYMADIDDTSVVTTMCNRILQATASPFMIDGLSIKVTFSIGICIYPKDGTQIEELIKRADDVMYVTKMKSGNNFQYYGNDMEMKL